MVNLYHQRFLPTRERFEEKIVPLPWSGCWIWMANIYSSKNNKLQYGKFFAWNKSIVAHRAAWIIYRGAIPERMLVCHKCDVPYCVNPEHLFLGTHADNTSDMVAKGRNRPCIEAHIGEKNHFAKLSMEQAMEIRNSTENQYVIAERFGISQSCVSLIRRRKNWKHIDG